jgi:hypothetical protein
MCFFAHGVMPAILCCALITVTGTMEDGQHLTYTFWGFLVLLSLETSELVDYQEYISNTIITQASLFDFTWDALDLLFFSLCI